MKLLPIYSWLSTPRYRRSSGGTVRYMFPATIATAAALGLYALSGASTGSYVYLETPNQTIEAGTVFPVTIKATAAVPVNAVSLTLRFSEDAYEVFGVDRGQSVITIWTAEPEIAANYVSLSGGTFRRGFLGEHTIAVVNLRAVETGQHSIEIADVTLVAGDGEGSEVVSAETSRSKLTLYNFNDETTAEEIQVAIERNIVTDINADGSVTLTDISAFMGAWSSKSRIFDFDGDGRMSFRDFSIILADFFLQ